MRFKNISLFILLFGSYIGVTLLYGNANTKFETGIIINNVLCQKNPQQSYALYLPSYYSPNDKWPILYAFDPGARGIVPLKHFKDAAEQYGYILVGSNNAKNGPWEPIYRAGRAMWLDTTKRFNIDFQQIYATGFSGGARTASTFQYISKNPVAGIIGFGAGLNTSLKPEALKSTFYYGIVGLEDFNYSEMMDLDKKLDGINILHRILVIDGGHNWAPVEYCTQALEWMEINSMKQGLKKKSKPVINRILHKAQKRAEDLEKLGNILFTTSAYEEYIQLAEGLKENEPISNKLKQIKESSKYKSFQKDEVNRSKRELEIINKYSRINHLTKNNMESISTFGPIIHELKIPRLLKEANSPVNKMSIYDRASAKRILAILTLQAHNAGNESIQQGDVKRAELFFEIAINASDNNPNMIYNVACLFSLAEMKKKALQYFKQSIKNGFNDINHIKKDTDLDYIRDEKEFKKIILKLQ